MDSFYRSKWYWLFAPDMFVLLHIFRGFGMAARRTFNRLKSLFKEETD